MISIRLLGSPHLQIGQDEIVVLPTQKCTLLLGYLALNQSVRLDRITLASWLWPEHSESRARRNLNNESWRLRKYLGNALIADSKSITFAPGDNLMIDVDLFDRVDKESSIPEIEEAISQYEGEFMSGYFEDWVLVRREYYADRLVGYLDRCAIHYQNNLEVRKAVACVRRILLHEPVNEESHRRLMRLYVLIDDFYSAIWQYRECVEILERELNVPPMPETETLYQWIVKESQARVGRQRHIVQPEKVFVGRENDLKELNAKWADVMNGRTQSVVVTGESGIGKTRVVEHWLEGMHHRGVILRGRCSEMDQRAPYRPIIEMLRSAISEMGEVELHRLSATVVHEIGRLLPDLPLSTHRIESAPLPPAQARERLVESLMLALRAWSSPEKPLILFLDDLQWADAETMDVVKAMFQREEDAPILFIATQRPDPLALADGDHGETHIKNLQFDSRVLEPLSRGEVVELIRRMGNLPNAPQAFAERIYAETEGNPLFIVESLRGLFDTGHLSSDTDGIWRISLERPIAELPRLPLSAGLRAAILERVERLNVKQREVLALAAVIGKEFDNEIILSITGLDDSAIQDVLAGLLRYGLIREVSTQTRFDFSHVKIQEVLLASMPDSKRHSLHLQVAHYLESYEAGDSSKPFERLAYHFHQGGDEKSALRYFQQAGEDAVTLHAYKVGASYFESALSLCPDAEPAEKRFSLLMKLYLCLWSTDLDHLRLDRMLEEAREIAEKNQKSDFLAQAYFYSGLNFVSQGRWVDAESLLRRSLDHAATSGLTEIEMRARIELANLLQYMRRADEAMPHIEVALALAERAGDFRVEGRARWDMAQASMGVADQARVGIDLIQRALEKNALALLVELGSGAVGILWRAGNPGGAIQLGEQIFAYGREQGFAGFVRSVNRVLARVYCAIGGYEIALQLAGEALRASRMTGYRYGEMRSLICLALANAGLGFFDDALETMNRAMELCAQIGSKTDLLTARLETCGILLRRGDEALLSRAESLARQTLAESREAGLRSAEIFALAHLSHISLAENRLEEAVQFSSQSVAVMESPENRDIGLEPLVYFNHFRALQRMGDESCISFLHRARSLLYCSAVTLPPHLRRSYLHRDLWNRLISQARRS